MSTKRKQVTLAVIGSVGIHLAVLFAWALSVQWFPAAQAAVSAPPEEIKLQMVEEKPDTPPPSVPEPVPKATPPKPVVINDTIDPPDSTSPPPKDAAFQSDKNSEAASGLPAAGDKPLPTQKGRQVPSFAFDSHPAIPGDDGDTAGQNVPANMPPPVLATAPPPPHPISTPAAVPTATPAASVSADPRDLAMVTPQSIPATPADPDPNPYDPSIRPPVNMTEPPRPTPVPRRGGYQPLQLRSASVGGIENSGTNSVASEESPAGRYFASIKRAVNFRYHKYVDARAALIVLGAVTVRFTVNRDGKVTAARVVSNNANEALASVCIRAVTEAQISPMPAEVAASFNGGVWEMSINFTLEDSRN